MAQRCKEPVDGTTATTHVAYFMSDSAFIFPITPSSVMSEVAHEWSMNGRKNAFGQPTMVRQMQSEAGSAGALHGALSEGALATTFTSSQGLLLMIPNMYKIAGELLPCVMHIAARTVATEALSIFGDHTDVYAVRSTGFAFLCSATVQECIHMSAAAHAATLSSEVPFAHFFDGFRTSHEIQKIDFPSDADLLACMNFDDVRRFRGRSLCCERPLLRGTAQNPDVFMQASESNLATLARVPAAIDEALARVNKVFGTNYRTYEYYGHPEATDVIVAMGSGTEVAISTANFLNSRDANSRVGVVRVRLFRPFVSAAFVAALPKTVKRICVLDRGRDGQAAADPLHQDVLSALGLAAPGRVQVCVGGVYGLSSKDFNPDHVIAVYRNLASASPKNRFSVGIVDDVTHNSLDMGEHVDALPQGTKQCLLWGIGGDGTIGANKTAIKLIADHTELHAQGYFAYDANKAGGLTVSHLRFGPTRFEAPYLVNDSNYVACHNFSYVHRFNLLSSLRTGGTFVLNCPCRTVEELDTALPVRLRREIARRQAKFYVIDATKIAKDNGMGPFINMVLQAVFFYLSHVLDVNEAVALLKKSIQKMYARKGEEVVRKNVASVDASLDPKALLHIEYPADRWLALADEHVPRMGLLTVPERLQKFNAELYEPTLAYDGESIPVSRFPRGGETPTGTTQLGKRGIAESVPHWNHEKCVQCNQCSFVCPHAVIRSYQISEEEMKNAPAGFDTLKSRKPGYRFRINVSALDCTGCSVCVEQCPVKCLEMKPLESEFEMQKDAIRFVREMVAPKPELGDRKTPVGIASHTPLFEFPGACAGCGETPLVRLVTQMFGERMVIAAATGCNSIWGASFPNVPYTTNARGEGPAWHNSLFEDAAELGYGITCAYRQRRERLIGIVRSVVDDAGSVQGLSAELKALLVEWLAHVRDFEKTRELRDRMNPLIDAIPANADCRVLELREKHNRELIARTSFWILGGDGWAYDIGFGGLDHVIANNEDVNILVLDTEVYSNTGGQRSKSTPLGARAKYAVLGKDTGKKDLGRIAMTYETAYVASIAQGANQQQCMDALREAEAYQGPSIVIAYTPCMEHQMVRGMKESQKNQKLAVETGYWLLYRFNPDLIHEGKNPFTLDSKPPSKPPKEFLDTQGRFITLQREHPEQAHLLHEALTRSLATRFVRYQRLVQLYEPAAPAAAPATH
uniref:Pyruvate:ferredoxin oxidoreductase n=1 Tax=Mastigamoeba balamuthi TaxID=108607 RepID=Q8MTH4_MASBA|nr:pyruvate:ferredoxin oxidoreductase [Mastigamoeba balamuthi]